RPATRLMDNRVLSGRTRGRVKPRRTLLLVHPARTDPALIKAGTCGPVYGLHGCLRLNDSSRRGNPTTTPRRATQPSSTDDLRSPSN
ncbi:MAG TPA: hypothetical protein VGH56_11365, partial [Solirubrobacteraceae bacterium]